MSTITATTTINRREIMLAAWALIRQGQTKSAALKAAWAAAKGPVCPWTFEQGKDPYVQNGTYVIATYKPTGVRRVFSSCFGSIEAQLKAQKPHTWGTHPKLEFAVCGEWLPSKEMAAFEAVVAEMQQSLLNAFVSQGISLTA